MKTKVVQHEPRMTHMAHMTYVTLFNHVNIQSFSLVDLVWGTSVVQLSDWSPTSTCLLCDVVPWRGGREPRTPLSCAAWPGRCREQTRCCRRPRGTPRCHVWTSLSWIYKQWKYKTKFVRRARAKPKKPRSKYFLHVFIHHVIFYYITHCIYDVPWHKKYY